MNVFIAGGSGYIGRRLIQSLLERNHSVEALVRPGSEKKLPAGCVPRVGDALKGDTFASFLRPHHVFIQLVGVAHPGPGKAKEFETIDLPAGLESVRVAAQAKVRQFIYLSVAQPAPVMKAYVAVRARVEASLRASGLKGSVVRPWYVLGPGHWWPLVLVPAYAFLKMIPGVGETARRLDLVTLGQMVRSLVYCVENPSENLRVIDVPVIRGK